jgi:hypothetical protein
MGVAPQTILISNKWPPEIVNRPMLNDKGRNLPKGSLAAQLVLKGPEITCRDDAARSPIIDCLFAN